MMTDPIADMLSRIRNANRAVHESTSMPSSRLKEQIAKILKDEGYIKDYRILSPEDWKAKHPNAPDRDVPAFDTLVIDLKFGRNRERVISGLKRISKPGRRVYARKDRLPRVLGGMGVAILSTSSGVMTGRSAEQQGVGGEVICFVW